MSYESIALMAADAGLAGRLVACAAQEDKGMNPAAWVATHKWQIVSASQEWADAWDYAIGTNVQNIGVNAGVINDAMILSVIQPMGY